MKSDLSSKTDIEEELRGQPAVNAAHIGVSVTERRGRLAISEDRGRRRGPPPDRRALHASARDVKNKVRAALKNDIAITP